ncbi:unnamed protein product [Durusdinium trenchii]|uniref:Uncharacterized protein n=1 Tax=Durusdinium trenchii TaxID=1381693 RepID=A0ABP0HA23_9DINO
MPPVLPTYSSLYSGIARALDAWPETKQDEKTIHKVRVALAQRRLGKDTQVPRPRATAPHRAPSPTAGSAKVTPTTTRATDASKPKRKRIIVVAPGAGTRANGQVYAELCQGASYKIEVLGHSMARYDRYPESWHHGAPAPNLSSFALEVVGDAMLADCLVLGSRGGQVVLPKLWEAVGNALPPAVVINGGCAMNLPEVVAWPTEAVTFLLIGGCDHFRSNMTPEEYLVSTQQCVPATNQSTALLYINEMEHMPQSHLFALILPHLLRVCLAWKRKVEVAPLRELQCLLTELNSCKGEWTGCLSFTSGAGWTDVPFGEEHIEALAVEPPFRVLFALRCQRHQRQNATHELLDLLRQVDFAGIEQLSDQDFWQSLNSTWGQIHHSCGGTKGFGVYPFDLASLLYRQTGGWAPSGQPVGGCMEKVNKSSQVNDYRAYVGQAFVHKDTGLQVIVMVAHFPHEGGYEAGLELLSAELQDLKRRSGVEEATAASSRRDRREQQKIWRQRILHKVLLLADTNQQKGNAEIMHDIDASSSAKTAGNDVQITCCYPEYFFSYDRIIAQNLEVTAVKTSFPFGIGADHHPPAWAVFNMHDPVLVELEMRGEPRSWAKAPSPAVLLTVLLAVVLAW